MSISNDELQKIIDTKRETRKLRDSAIQNGICPDCGKTLSVKRRGSSSWFCQDTAAILICDSCKFQTVNELYYFVSSE